VNPLNALALVAFVFTSLVITRLLSRVRREATSSSRQKDRLDRLYQLSQQLLVIDPGGVMSERFLEPFRRIFGAAGVCVFDASTAELYVVGDFKSELSRKTREAYLHGQDFEDPVARVLVRCLRLGATLTGAIGFKELCDNRETADALAGLAAGLLERTTAYRRTNAADAAAQVEVYRSAMLDALAHEFKTPLATILAAAGGIRQAGPLGTEQEEMTAAIESEAGRLGHLTSRLLRTARLDREEINPRMELIDIGSLTAHIAHRYAELSPNRLVILNSHETVEAPADSELLRLILSQLVDNACKYSAAGSRVMIEIGRQNDFATVRVSNTGSSIPYGERRRIFERFYRGAGASVEIAGSGLGLYVARKIALAHGGTLDLEAEDHTRDGVAFYLKIPAGTHVLTGK